MGDNAGVPDSLWKALFEWSIAQQDGTTTSTSQNAAAPSSDADRAWLEEALAAGVVDLSKQLVEIKAQLEKSLPASATEADIARDEEHKARLLDELLDLVESIDQAKDLSTIGGLSTLLHVIGGGVPGLQWRAAEVIATCAQNNPEVQASFFRDGVMPAIWGLLSSDDATCRLKALLAVSCMLRGSADVRRWWSVQDGAGKVVELVAHDKENKRIVRKCLQILNYVAEDPTAQDREQLVAHGAEIEQILVRTVSTAEDHDVEMAAIELGKSLGLQNLFKNQPARLLEAVQAYLATFDVVMHDKKDDWVCVEENISCGKALVDLLAGYRPAPVQGAASPSALQIVAVEEDAVPAGTHEEE